MTPGYSTIKASLASHLYIPGKLATTSTYPIDRLLSKKGPPLRLVGACLEIHCLASQVTDDNNALPARSPGGFSTVAISGIPRGGMALRHCSPCPCRSHISADLTAFGPSWPLQYLTASSAQSTEVRKYLQNVPLKRDKVMSPSKAQGYPSNMSKCTLFAH